MISTKNPKKLSDYSYYHQSAENYAASDFEHLADIQKRIALAYQNNTPLRIRGKGHSMNGNSLPREKEHLLSTAECVHFRFEQPGTITVGAGSAIWDVNLLLKTYGYELYVVNDGNAPAASVGGYLSAGGFGEHSALYGGFWETVEKVVLINGKGEVMESVWGDGWFEWLFGSMGQLGLVYEMSLKIKPLQGSEPAYPLGVVGRVEQSHYDWEKIAWYNLFTTQEHYELAFQELVLLSQIHKLTWASRPIYKYHIAFKRFNPPLLFPPQEDFIVLGVWGAPWDEQRFNIAAIKQLEQDFTDIIQEHPYFRRYIQTEFLFENFDYKTYFGESLFADFQKIKRALDPKGIFGKGVLS